MKIVPVILAGGTGTRLWPRSRTALPKQFLNLGGERSLLVETVCRFDGDARFSAPLIAGSADHGFMVARELESAGIHPLAILAEPEKRNTAPAIAAVAEFVRSKEGPDAVLAIMPADHIVRDPAGLRSALMAAAGAAAEGKIVTIGITPNEPATGYGYIEVGAPLPAHSRVHEVARFVEKPDRSAAEAYLKAGNYLWNAGMFVARADVLLEEMETRCPEVASAAGAAVGAAIVKNGVTTLDRQSLVRAPSISFDYAVMEKTSRAAVVPADIGWTDVGSWSALWEVLDKDEFGNTTSGEVHAEDCRDNHIESDGRLVVALGLSRMMVVQTRDATLVAPLERAQEIGQLVDTLRNKGRAEIQAHTKVHRPWGWYDSLWQEAGFQVKHLMVAPGAAISLQLHHQRSEHWVVLRGRARVTRNDEIVDLETGQSTFIPLGARHRLENPWGEELHVIEVQLGDYLGENDIVRFEDRYDRV
ncbi:MAG: mannose-1-phosphate guanylyltransferase/mannose-6-phosphate isomerase [Alphaproteobacteria bacterium]|nr:mannose-1-phosphate guanylyltransferase/mannose-6-phosphate isomerase [Alphaproteobacteria bacterium]